MLKSKTVFNFVQLIFNLRIYFLIIVLFQQYTSQNCQPTQNIDSCNGANKYGDYIPGGGVQCCTCPPPCYGCAAWNPSLCAACIPPLVLANSQCYQCNQLHSVCAECETLNGLMCRSCPPGYALNTLQGIPRTCFLCHPQCLTCQTNYVCSSCRLTYGLQNGTNGICVPCQVQFCAICYDHASHCQQCMSGNLIGKNEDICSPCAFPCQKCQTSHYMICITCEILYYYDPNEQQLNRCLPCVHPCERCLSPTNCQSCVPGFYLQGTTCLPCPRYHSLCRPLGPGILECVEESFQGEFKVNQNNVIVCTEKCGDLYTEIYECDNEKGVALDGCDDTCHTMQNFTCERNELNHSLCEYDAPLFVEFVQFTREPSNNSFTLVIKIVYPILNSFLVATEEEMNRMFGVSHKNIETNWITFDQEKHTLTFMCDFTADLVNEENMKIRFTQPYNLTETQILVTEFIFDDFYKPIFYSETEILTSKIILYLCWAVTVSGWLSFFIGMVFRKLGGVETIMMLQLCWTSLLANEGFYLLGFVSINPLKYVNGVNIHILDQGQEKYTQFPYHRQNGLNKKVFLNNFNSFFVFTCIFVAFAIFHFVRHFTSKSCSNRTKQTTSLLFPMLFQFCLCFLVSFVQNLCFMIKMGATEEIYNWVPIVIYLVIFLGTFTTFHFDPDKFDYFLYSFRLTSLATKHIYLQIATPIIIAVLAVFMGPLSFVVLIPSLLFCLETLVLKPFILRNENFCSVFRYFAISLFFAIQIFHKLIEISEQSRFLTNVMLISANVIVLIVIFVGNFFMIFHSNHKKQIKQIHNEALNPKFNEKYYKFNLFKEIQIESVNKKIKNHERKTLFNKILPGNKSIKQSTNALNYPNHPFHLKKLLTLQSQQSGHNAHFMNQHKKLKILKQSLIENYNFQTRNTENDNPLFIELSQIHSDKESQSVYSKNKEEQQQIHNNSVQNSNPEKNEQLPIVEDDNKWQRICKNIITDEHNYINYKSVLEKNKQIKEYDKRIHEFFVDQYDQIQQKQ